MTQLPAVVTIPDLVPATTLLSSALVEAAQTTNGVGESVSFLVSQLMTTGFGALPTGGGTGQLLTKASGTDFASQWSNIASAVLGTSGITTSGSTTVTVQFAAATPLSVLGVAGTTSTAPLPIVGLAGQVLRVNDAGTAVAFGPVNLGNTSAVTGFLTVPFGGIGTTALPANGVVLGQGTSALTVVPAAATGLVLLSQGTALAPIFTSAPPPTITIAGLSVLGVAGTASAAATAITGTTDQVLRVAQGGTTLGFGAINLATSAAVTGVLAVPNGGLGTAALGTFALVYGSGTAAVGVVAATTAGLFLQSRGTAAAAAWTSAVTGWGLTTGPSTGTLSIATTNPPYGFGLPINIAMTASIAGGILTVAFKANDGTDATATNPILVPFRSSLLSTGAPVWATVTQALSISTFSTGASLGATNSVAFRLWAVLFFQNATTVMPALINCSHSTQIFALMQDALQTTVAISSTASSAGVFYSPNGTTVGAAPFCIVGYVEYASPGLATAGTYSTAPTTLQLFGPGVKKPGETVQEIYVANAVAFSTSTSGVATTNLTQSITPISSVSLMSVVACGSLEGATQGVAYNATINRGVSAIGSPLVLFTATGGDSIVTGTMLAYEKLNTTVATTYVVKIQSNGSATATWSTGGRTSVMVVKELMG